MALFGIFSDIFCRDAEGKVIALTTYVTNCMLISFSVLFSQVETTSTDGQEKSFTRTDYILGAK